MEKISLQKLKWIRGLQIKKNREKEQLIVVEGDKIVRELLSKSEYNIQLIVATANFIELNITNIACFLAKPSELQKMSSFSSSPEAIAIMPKPKTKEINTNARTLILDGIQDPGNFGTIIRTANWFGITQIICSNSTVDQYNPKTIQASMGSVFQVAIHYTDLVKFLSKIKEPIYGALLKGDSIYKTNLSKMKFLVLGNEGNGISKEVLQLITNPILIPGKGSAESLNVGIACGIFLSEWNRSY